MSVKTLYPFSATESLGGKGDFLEQLFAGDLRFAKGGGSLQDALRCATFPEISGATVKERYEWCEGYLTPLLQRGVRMLSQLEKIAMLPNLLRVLANRAGSLMNDAEIARDIGLNPVQAKAIEAFFRHCF